MLVALLFEGVMTPSGRNLVDMTEPYLVIFEDSSPHRLERRFPSRYITVSHSFGVDARATPHQPATTQS